MVGLIGGSIEIDYVLVVEKLVKLGLVSVLEFNVFCFNVVYGGMVFGIDVKVLELLIN